MVAAEVELKSPLSPFSKWEFTPILTPLYQRGEGEIFRTE